MNIRILLLALIIVIISFVPMISHGEKQYSQELESNIIRAKELFDIGDGYDKFNSNISSYNGKTIFYLNWRDSKALLDDINLAMDKEGRVISYNISLKDSENKRRLPKYSREEAESKARDFIKRVSSDIKNIKLIEDEGPENLDNNFYNFSYIRYENQIPYYGNSIEVSIDKDKGLVRDYYVNWDRDIEFVPKKAIISLERAKRIFKEEIALKPVYKIRREDNFIDRNEELEYYLAYTLIDTNQGIDASSGEKVRINYYSAYREEMEVDSADAANISPEERIGIDRLKDILDEKQALKLAKELIEIEADYELEGQNLYKDYKNIEAYIWNMYFINPKDDSNINISIDAKTGELLGFYKSKNFNSEEKGNLDKEAALKLAKDYLKSQIPDKVKDLELIEDSNYFNQELEAQNYNFNFIRKDKDIYVEDDNVYLGVDAIDGEIISYSIDWYRGEFPKIEKTIGIEKAYEILWDRIGLDLYYINRPEGDLALDDNKTMRLTYLLDPGKPAIIDAVDGRLLNYSGQAYIETKTKEYSDIDESYAREKIKILADYGIGPRGDSFLPKEKMEQGEFLWMLWKSKNQYRDDEASEKEVYDYFINSGYMSQEEKNPQGLLSKLDAIKYIIRIMDLREVAEIEGIYKDIFLDQESITEDMKGYVNLAYGLGIIHGDGRGNLRPKDNIKREDGANIIYNYIFRK